MSPGAWTLLASVATAAGVVIAASFAARAARLSKPTGNGFAALVTDDLRHIRTTMDAHVASSSARHGAAEKAVRDAVTLANQARAATEVLRRELSTYTERAVAERAAIADDVTAALRPQDAHPDDPPA